jgi:hypothetical protein
MIARQNRTIASRPVTVILLVAIGSLLVSLHPATTRSYTASTYAGPRPVMRAWSTWTSLGLINGRAVKWPVVGQNQDGRLEVFAGDDVTGTAYSVYHLWQIAPNGSWSNWAAVGPHGDGVTAPAVAQNLDGRMEVFAQGLWFGFGPPYPGPHYELSHIPQTAPNDGWASWASLDQPWVPGPVELWEPYVGRNLDGRLDVFARGGDGNLWRIAQTAANDGWGSWANLGRPAGVTISPVLSVGRNQDGRLAVFALGSNCEIYHVWQNAPNDDTNWSGWVGFGRPPGVNLSEPTVSQNQDGRLEFFASGNDGGIWHKWQVAPNIFWSGWGSLGKPSGVALSNTVVGRHEDGVMDVFARGSDSAVWHIWQTAPSNGWAAWESLSKPGGVSLTDQLAVGRNADGRMVLFAVGQDGALWTRAGRNVAAHHAHLPIVVK